MRQLIIVCLVLNFWQLFASGQDRLVAITAKTRVAPILQQRVFQCFVPSELITISMKLSYDYDIIAVKC